MNRQQARRQFVLLENSADYRLGQSRTDWLLFAIWGLVGLVGGAVLAGAGFLVWLAVGAVLRGFN